MQNTTLCYIERDGSYLMLHRSSKKNDGSGGKWMGIGGHFEEGESPYDCVIREVYEESSLKLISPKYRAVVTFSSDKYESEQMHLFTCDSFEGEAGECNEGELQWIKKQDISKLNMWCGDIIFLNYLDTRNEFFSLKLEYKGEELISYYLDGVKIK